MGSVVKPRKGVNITGGGFSEDLDSLEGLGVLKYQIG